jgi:hypothetical protein
LTTGLINGGNDLNYTISRLLDTEELDRIWKDIGQTAGWRYITMSGGNSHWNYPVMSINDQRDVPIEERWFGGAPDSVRQVYQKICKLHPNHKLMRLIINGQTHGMDSGIHFDSTHTNARTYIIYLNPEWKPEWGGTTRFYTDVIGQQLIHEQMPEPGMMFGYSGSTWHQGCGPTVANVLRVTLAIQIITE